MGYKGYRVVAFIPYGRKVTVSVLWPYLHREHERGLLDELMLCLNTDPGQEDDLAYAHALAGANKWVNTYDCPGPDTSPDLPIPHVWKMGKRTPKQMNTCRFYWYMQDRNTIYVRFDDDIIWLHPAALVTLVDRKIRRPERLGVFPVIINNAVSTWFLQTHNRLPTEDPNWPMVRPHAVDPVGWGDPRFAEQLHRATLDAIRGGWIDDWLVPVEHELGKRQQFSVSCFSISGNEFADLDGVLDWDEEEHWLTQYRTGVTDRANIICGQALVAHYTFFTQRDRILQTDILDQYRDLADHIRPSRWAKALLPEGETAPVTVDDPELDARGNAYYTDLHG